MSALQTQPVVFDSFASLGRVAASTIAVYVMVMVFIRISGKRSTSKMNNFDWIVTVAVGSITASTIVLRDVVFLDGAVAIGLLIAIQFLVTWGSVRSRAIERIVKMSPTLLAHNGELCEDAMRTQRVTRREIDAAVRGAGLPCLEAVAAVILENDAGISVIPSSALKDGQELAVLRNVQGDLPP
ncbi:hypothetical protein ENSA5_29720 [Enhygromyxa salina]|uniref:YetF C-terminal domain-containing protein n=1 Tax=Enhygromyxa salina TaxID=215803 RepID=A0A2S9Y066_9BACT|nr:YetF domain-containing protein [Enhygromyxa salina]PRP98502.1 hypothetical protein ENSA5_29720 [Enhygromyxa salina]